MRSGIRFGSRRSWTRRVESTPAVRRAALHPSVETFEARILLSGSTSSLSPSLSSPPTDTALPPVAGPIHAADDVIDTDEGNPVTINVVANDTSGSGINPSTVALTSRPSHGTILIDPSSGAITYNPNVNFSGADKFSYTVRDNAGATSNSATVRVSVRPPTAFVSNPSLTAPIFILPTPILSPVHHNRGSVRLGHVTPTHHITPHRGHLRLGHVQIPRPRPFSL